MSGAPEPARAEPVGGWQPSYMAPKDGSQSLWRGFNRDGARTYAVIQWPEFDLCFEEGEFMAIPGDTLASASDAGLADVERLVPQAGSDLIDDAVEASFACGEHRIQGSSDDDETWQLLNSKAQATERACRRVFADTITELYEARATIASLRADANRSEDHRNDLYDRVVALKTERGALNHRIATLEATLALRDRDLRDARAEGAGRGEVTAELRRAWERLERVTKGDVGFPECVEAERSFVLTAYEDIGARIAAAPAQATPDHSGEPHA